MYLSRSDTIIYNMKMKIWVKSLAVLVAVVALAVVAIPAADAAYTRDLTIGSTGSDVAELQAFLVSKGYLVMPAGVSMGYFGSLTQAALASYQAASGIAPAAGYFGPITRAAVVAAGVSIVTDDGDDNEDDEDDEDDDEDDDDDDNSGTSREFSINDEDDTYEVFMADEAGEGDIGHFEINFEVTAGDDDLYIGGASYEFSESLANFSTSSSFTGPSSKRQGNGNYKVSRGQTEKFTVMVELEADPGASNTAQRMVLTEILWNTDNSDADYNSYTSRLNRYETKTLFLRGL